MTRDSPREAIAAGDLPKKATYDEARSVWETPAFLAGRQQEDRVVCALLRDILGNPFRPQVMDPAWLAWQDGTIPRKARAVYDEEAFDRLPLLADALEDAGCANPEILGHLRGPGVHVRGCWVVDLILGRS